MNTLAKNSQRDSQAVVPARPAWLFLRRTSALSVVAMLALLAWDASGLDLPLAQWAGTAEGFALRHNHGFTVAFHQVPRAISIALVVALLAGMALPWGFMKKLSAAQRAQLALSVLGAVALTALVKRTSATSCPWDLQQFGGAVPYVSHWAWGVSDGGPGHCFPAGHASAAFGFVAGWWVLRRTLPGLATWWLSAALVAGLLLGVSQQIRGAHFMSHTLWTAWICWSFGLAWECLRVAWVRWRSARRALRGEA